LGNVSIAGDACRGAAWERPDFDELAAPVGELERRRDSAEAAARRRLVGLGIRKL